MVLAHWRNCGWSMAGVAFLMFMIVSCKSSDIIPFKDPVKITLGSFGGFAGTFKEYSIDKDGLLSMKTKHQGSTRELSKLDNKTVRQLFSVLSDLEKKAKLVYSPGNMTYFIKLHHENQEPVEWVWGGGEEPENQIKSVYRILSKLCRAEENPIR